MRVGICSFLGLQQGPSVTVTQTVLCNGVCCCPAVVKPVVSTFSEHPLCMCTSHVNARARTQHHSCGSLSQVSVARV